MHHGIIVSFHMLVSAAVVLRNQTLCAKRDRQQLLVCLLCTVCCHRNFGPGGPKSLILFHGEFGPPDPNH